MSELYLVSRAEFSIDDPWRVPERSATVPLVRSTDGAAARLRSEAAVYHGAGVLTIVFLGEDDHVVSTHLAHDAPLYEEDVYEVFLSPSNREEYFELEVNPLGTTFDARILSPDGVRATMRADRDWECAGLFAATRRRPGPGGTFDAVLRVPFAALGRGEPEPDEVWRANLYRIDRHPVAGDEFLAWRPTFRTPADFHVTAAFGALRFV